MLLECCPYLARLGVPSSNAERRALPPPPLATSTSPPLWRPSTRRGLTQCTQATVRCLLWLAGCLPGCRMRWSCLHTPDVRHAHHSLTPINAQAS